MKKQQEKNAVGNGLIYGRQWGGKRLRKIANDRWALAKGIACILRTSLSWILRQITHGRTELLFTPRQDLHVARSIDLQDPAIFRA